MTSLTGSHRDLVLCAAELLGNCIDVVALHACMRRVNGTNADEPRDPTVYSSHGISQKAPMPTTLIEAVVNAPVMQQA